MLASYAMHSRDTAGRVLPRAAAPLSRTVRTRSRSDSAQQCVSSAVRKDAGLYRRDGNLPSHAIDAHLRGLVDRPHDGPRAAVERGPDRSSGVDARHRSSTVRALWRRRAQRVHAGRWAGFRTTSLRLVIVQELEQRYSQFPGSESLGGNACAAKTCGRTKPRLLWDARRCWKYNWSMRPIRSLTTRTMSTMPRKWDCCRSTNWRSWRSFAGRCDQVREKHGRLPNVQLRQSLVHELIDLQVSDLLQVAAEQLAAADGRSADDVCDAGLRLRHSEQLDRERSELEAFLFDAVYRHPRLIPVRDAAAGRLRDLFDVLLRNPNRLPLRFRKRSQRTHLAKSSASIWRA